MITHKGSFFVVPNLAMLVTSRAGCLTRTEVREFEIVVQCWLYSDECDNWSDHGGPAKQTCIPLVDIANLKEGETVSIEGFDRDNNECVFELTACQLQSRYRDFGPFETALRVILEKGPNYPIKWGKFERQMKEIWDELVKGVL